MLKGRTLIELTDVRTGEKKKITHDNMITNAINNEVLVQRGLLSPPSILPAYTSNNLSANTAIAVQLFGGIYLWNNQLNTDANDYWIPTDNKMIGYSYFNAENASSNNQLGSYSPTESGLQSDGSYKHVWDFSTSQANGEISAVSLVPNVAGIVSAGISNDNYVSSKCLPGGTYAYSTSESRVNYYKMGMCVDIDNDYAYFIRPENFTTNNSSDTNKFIGNNGKKLTIYRAVSPKSGLCLNSGILAHNEYYDSFDIQLPDTFDISLFGSGSSNYGFIICNSGELYISVSTFSTSSLNVLKINLKSREVLTYDITFTAEVYLPKINYDCANGVMSCAQSKVSISNNTVFAIDYYGNILYCDLTNTLKGTVSNAPASSTGMGDGWTYVSSFDFNNHIYCKLYPGNYRTGIINTTDYTNMYINDSQTSASSLYHDNIKKFSIGYVYTSISSNTYEYIYPATVPMFLTTKNNLEQSVIKTSAQSMKVTYTLTPA